MKHAFYKLMVPMLAFLLLASSSGFAQENRTGTNAASELLIPVGARYMAMGSAPLATVSGVDAIYYNPAGLAISSENADAMFSSMKYFADINVNYVAVSANFGGFGSLGFSVKSLDIGDIPITTVDAPDGTGAIFAPQFVTVGLTYAKALSDRVSVGATTYLVTETLDRANASTVAFDFGVQYRGVDRLKGLALGVAIKHVGPAMQYGGTGLLAPADREGDDRPSTQYQLVAQTDELPATLEMGVSYVYDIDEKSKLDISTMYQDNNFSDDVASLGLEYAYDNMLFIRFGYNAATAASERYIYGATVGAGFNYSINNLDLRLDYAWRQLDVFNSSNVFTLGLGF